MQRAHAYAMSLDTSIAKIQELEVKAGATRDDGYARGVKVTVACERAIQAHWTFARQLDMARPAAGPMTYSWNFDLGDVVLKPHELPIVCEFIAHEMRIVMPCPLRGYDWRHTVTHLPATPNDRKECFRVTSSEVACPTANE